MDTKTVGSATGSLVGRAALATIFLLSSFGKLAHYDATAAMMGTKGVPWPAFLLAIAAGLELVGGLAVLIGWKARWGALALVVFLIPVTLVFHNFWAVTGPAQQDQMIHFLKNLAILGGLFTVMSHGAGAYSLDGWLARGRVAKAEHTLSEPAHSH